MPELIYLTNVSLDGFIEDSRGTLDWAPRDDEVFASATAIIQSVGTLVYGRRLYESMALWETDPSLGERSSLTAEFASAWQAADKVVYSRTISDAPTAATRIERDFDPDGLRAVLDAATRDATIGGAALTAEAFAAGLVGECRLFVWPTILGSGKPAFAPDVRAELQLIDERRFASGVLELRYRVAR